MPGGSRPVSFRGPGGFPPLNTGRCTSTVCPGFDKAGLNIEGGLSSVGLNIEEESSRNPKAWLR